MELFRELWNAVGLLVDAILARGGWELDPDAHAAARITLILATLLAAAAGVELVLSPWRELWARLRYAGIRSEATREEIRQLRRQGDLEELGRLFLRYDRFRPAARELERAGRPELAARAWHAGGMLAEAIDAWDRAGLPIEAARALEQAGRDPEAARLYLEGGAPARAAECFRRAGESEPALEAWVKTLDDPGPDPDQTDGDRAVEGSLEILASGDEISREVRDRSLPSLARELESRRRPAEAAALWEEIETWEAAGHARAAAADPVRARENWRRAGRDDLVARLDAKERETEEDWAGAAEAWARGRAPEAAAAAWERAGRPLRAAERWEEAGDPYRAGRAWADGAAFDRAARSLQLVPEESPDYEASRLLLGRCFYLMDDWADAVATLENHLLNERVNRSNLELFYMLALAHEQLDNPARALELFYKIHAVDLDFRDVHERIETIADSWERGPILVPEATDSGVASAANRSPESRYRIEEEIGRGGMGIVFRAWDRLLERPVALKKLSLPAERERFRREARAAAGLQHPHLVTVYDYWETGTDAYLAMELVEGPTLAQELRRRGGPLEPSQAIRLAIELCQALGALHERGIFHRDVKPENVFLTEREGRAKLGDFGLAREARDDRMTNPGSAMGTPFYLAPEQVEGSPGDERSDLYALGLVFHESLTGRTWFAGRGDPLVRKLREDPPPPSELGIRTDPAVDEILVRALARRPERRFASAAAFEEALRRVPLLP